MANDHLTLDEIGVQHDTMQSSVIAKSSDKIFDSIGEAAYFTKDCIQKAIENMGLTIDKNTPPDIVESLMKEKKIEIQQYKSNEHTGTYFYIDTELQYFISDIERKTGDIIFHKPKWVVRTNVTV